MLLSAFAARLDELEGARTRTRRVALVAELLRAAATRERAAVVYLLQARLRPVYEQVEIGLGEKLLLRALAVAYPKAGSAIRRALAKYGDLGSVAALLAPKGRRRGLTVRRAYEALLAVARAAGPGSLEEKTARFAALLREAGPAEAKMLVRIAQGRLRLGIGDQTILEGAALATLGRSDRKPLLEQAYNVRADLGAVVELAFAGGEAALRKVRPQVGVPVRPALAQRLPSAAAIIARLGVVHAEPKYDGLRLQIHRDGNEIRIFTRRLEEVSAMFPELSDSARRQVRARRAILDGEALASDPATGRFLPFQVTMTRKRKTRIAEMARRYPLRFVAFDVLYAGRSYLHEPQRVRYRRLSGLVQPRSDGAIMVTEGVTVKEASALQAYFDRMVSRGLEGVIAKRPDAPYRAGARGYDWVKLKRVSRSAMQDTVDLVIVGYFRGRGKRASLGVGSLLAAVYDPTADRFRTVARVGSGLSDAEWRSLRRLLDRDAVAERPARVDSLITPDVWVEPRHVIEVLAEEVTRSPRHTCGRSDGGPGYALRFPRIVRGIRSDRSPEDATTEREILEMHARQSPPRASARRGAPATR